MAEVETTMSIPHGPTEGGSGGNRGHSNMEHWGYTGEVKTAARKRRRLNDKPFIVDQLHDGSHTAGSSIGKMRRSER